MMRREHIDRFSPMFQLVLWLGALYHRIFYRKFVITGKEHIPSGTPLMFVANHQNGLMDPLAIIFSTRMQIVFMARADIFRKKSIARWLYFLKVLPIYRPRDGFRSVDKNQEVFIDAVKAIRNLRPVGILPEGNHAGRKQLRPFRKGAARMALMAGETMQAGVGLQVVPAGLDYSDYFHAGSDLLVHFGKPILINNYLEEYAVNPAVAINRLKGDMERAIREVVLDVQPGDYYACILTASSLACPVYLRKKALKQSMVNAFHAKKLISGALKALAENKDERLDRLKGYVKAFEEELSVQGLNINWPDHSRTGVPGFMARALAMVMLCPVFLYGLAVNILPYYLSGIIAKKPVDPHLQISVRFGAGFFLFGLWFILASVLIILLPLPAFWKVIFILSVPLTGISALYYSKALSKLRDRKKWLSLRWKKKEVFARVTGLKNKIVDLVLDTMDI